MSDSTLLLTDGEHTSLDHFNHETFNHYLGPAISWLKDQNLDWKLMSVFQRWGVLHDPDFMRKINDEVPIPPIEIPWSSREAFISRVEEFLRLYPDLRPLIRPYLKVEIPA